MKWKPLITCRWVTASVIVSFWGISDLFVSASQAQTSKPPPEVLNTAEQVHRLSREEAAAEHPAVIRGVVTCSLPQYEAVVIQDSTRGVYVSHLGSNLGEP